MIRIRQRGNLLSVLIGQLNCHFRGQPGGKGSWTVVELHDTLFVETACGNGAIGELIERPALSIREHLAQANCFFLNAFGAEAVGNRKHNLSGAGRVNPGQHLQQRLALRAAVAEPLLDVTMNDRRHVAAAASAGKCEDSFGCVLRAFRLN